MNRIDYTAAYLRYPADPSPAFPARDHVWLPSIDVVLVKPGGKGFRTLAFADTGAAITLFPTAIADAIEIDWAAAPTCPVHGISGRVEAHVVPLRLVLCGARYDWPANVGFLPSLSFALLGHDGFFEHFEVRFKTAQRQVRIFLK